MYDSTSLFSSLESPLFSLPFFFFFLPFSDKSYRRSSARASRKWKLIRRISILPRIQSRINSAGFVPTTLRIDFRYCDVRIKGSKSNRSSPPPSPRFGYVYFFSNGYDPLPSPDMIPEDRRKLPEARDTGNALKPRSSKSR